MSCTYRTTIYRRCVAAQGGWNRGGHASVITNAKVPLESSEPQSHDTTDTPSILIWYVLCDLLDAPDTYTRNEALRLLSIGADRFPLFTDADIESLWEKIVSTHGASVKNTSMLGASALIGRMFITASESRRRKMWNIIRDAFLDYHGYVLRKNRYDISRSAIVLWAIRSGIPLWIIPDEIDALAATVDDMPSHMLDALHRMLHSWRDIDHPNIRKQNLRLLTDVLARYIPQSKQALHALSNDTLTLFLETIVPILRLDPSVITIIPGLVDTIIAASLSKSESVATAAMSVFSIVYSALPPHQVVSHLERVIRQSTVDMACILAGDILQKSFSQVVDIQRIVATAWSAMTDSVKDPERRQAASALMNSLAQRESVIPILASYLRPNMDTMQVLRGYEQVLRTIARSSIADTMVDDLIAWADLMLTNRCPDSAVEIVMALWDTAWKTGCGQRIIDLIRTRSKGVLSDEQRMVAVQPGIYDPQVGIHVVTMISNLASYSDAEQRRWILNAIGLWYHENRPIPRDVLPTVIRSWIDHPEPVATTVLQAMTTTDLDMVMTMFRQRIERNAQVAMTEIGQMWGIVDDDRVVDLMYRAIPHLIHDHPGQQMLMQGVFQGIGRGNVNTIIHLGYRILESIPSNTLPNVLFFMRQQRDVWERRDSWLVVHFLRYIYDRSPTMAVTRSILDELTYGWRCGCDDAICAFAVDMLRNVLDYYTDHCAKGGITIQAQDLFQYFLRMLNQGWGTGHDRTIGTMILTMMRWLDRWNPKWMEQPIARWFANAITYSGSPQKDMRSTPMSIRYVRNAFEQRLSALFPS